VNISVKEIEDSGFLSRVDDALAVSGLPPHALTIELTESAFLRDQPLGRAALRGLRERGVQLALDDFGTGFSSLSYLRRFPVDVIKIDRSFIADLLGDREEARVTQGLIALARTMETLLIAEGVEQQTQSDRLVDLGCNVAQGYLLGRPVPSEVLWAMASAAAGGPSDREPAIV
jgi:EAL domain-containing protein (putative c-di-GMP-specific phosphodiesterase class I)